MSGKRKSEFVDPQELVQGPVRQAFLPEELLARIAAVHEVFADVIPLSLQEWIDSFMRDRDPGGQMLTWEVLASIYTSACEGRDYPLEQRREIVELMIHRLHRSERKTLKEFELRSLTRDQALMIMSYMRVENKWVTAFEEVLGHALVMIRKFLSGV